MNGGNRIVIPHSLRLHEEHLGIEKYRRRSRDAVQVYWHGINNYTEDMIGNCETCKKHQRKQSSKPMITEQSKKVWTDIFHHNGKDYVLIINYHSNFPEIALLTNTIADSVITHVKSVFARHGILETVVNDNGPCYNCNEWLQFAGQYGFHHAPSIGKWQREYESLNSFWRRPQKASQILI